MALLSRNKGKSGEREVAGIISELTGWDVRRKVRQHDGDEDLDGIPGWSAESKRHKTANRGEVKAWWAQAHDQAIKTGRIPVLFYRKDRDEWRAVWPIAVNLGIQSAAMWKGYQWTVEGSLDAWSAQARELVLRTEGQGG